MIGNLINVFLEYFSIKTLLLLVLLLLLLLLLLIHTCQLSPFLTFKTSINRDVPIFLNFSRYTFLFLKYYLRHKSVVFLVFFLQIDKKHSLLIQTVRMNGSIKAIIDLLNKILTGVAKTFGLWWLIG